MGEMMDPFGHKLVALYVTQFFDRKQINQMPIYWKLMMMDYQPGKEGNCTGPQTPKEPPKAPGLLW